MVGECPGSFLASELMSRDPLGIMDAGSDLGLRAAALLACLTKLRQLVLALCPSLHGQL